MKFRAVHNNVASVAVPALSSARFSTVLSRKHSKQMLAIVISIIAVAQTLNAQTISYPKEIRGYKVERAAVELKDSKAKKPKARNTESVEEQRQLIEFGTPQVARITPLGISLEIPVVVSPVRQRGRVDFLVFEKMVVNGTAVEIDEYHRAFDLPNSKPLTLKEPLRFFVYLPSAILAAIDELSTGAKEWPVTGVVYVFGRFKKSVFRFKRVIPIELNMVMRNPLNST